MKQPSVHGLKHEVMDRASNDYLAEHLLRSRSEPIISTELLTSFETLTNTLHRAGRAIAGYFKAPASGNFRFTLSCDDRCFLEFDETPFDASNPTDPNWTEIASRHWACPWRFDFLENDEN